VTFAEFKRKTFELKVDATVRSDPKMSRRPAVDAILLGMDAKVTNYASGVGKR